MLNFTRVLPVFLVVLLLAGCSSPERIVFSSGRNGNSDLFIMDADGQNVRALTDSRFEEWGPTILSNNEVTFLREEGDSIRRYRLNLKTRKTTQIPHPHECVIDDKNVRYGRKSGRWVYTCDWNVYVYDPITKTSANLTETIPERCYNPRWFPDESRLIFTSDAGGQQDIWSVTPEGAALTNLTNEPSNEDSGEISPDGAFLLFSSDRGGNKNIDLFLKNLETGETQNITNTPDWELIGRWSTDGQSVYFGSNRDGNWEIYRYNRSDQSTARLTFDEGFDGDPRIFK